MTDDPLYDWDAIKAGYEDRTVRVVDLLVRHKISGTLLYGEAARRGWKLRRPSRVASRRSLIVRMRRMLELQIAHMEMNMTGFDEKEVALLGNMARTLEKLVELDSKSQTKKPDRKRSREMIALRKKLADRIDQLRKA
jgi:hypothetical protein